MDWVRSMIRWALVGVLFLVGCLAPWFFGTWEMWWFWPFTAVLAMGCVLAGIALFLGEGRFPSRAVWCLVLCLPFCVYILLRWWLGDVVYLDAERAVLLHLTGVFVAALVVFWLRDFQLPWLFWGLFGSLLAMAVYGILNHWVAESRHVLWAPRYEQYAGRATGPYFCPNHFAGAMELLIFMGLGLLLDRASCVRNRWMGGLAVVLGCMGAVMSLSRGSGLTLVVVFVLLMIVGFYQWPVSVRYGWRAVFVFGGLFVVISAIALAHGYRDRYVTYGGLRYVSSEQEEKVVAQVTTRLLRTSRGRMFTGAWLAWQTAPWLGTGPGMHRNLWPAFAHSGDGDREAGVWPSLVNDDFHSYEVHSDWLELLQEQGIVGTLLFLIGCIAVLVLFFRAFRRTAQHWKVHELDYLENPPEGFYLILAGFLSIGGMAVHSLGDFNLQMPGTVWMLAILVGLGIRASIAVD